MFQEGETETEARDRVEVLRQILEREQGRPVSYNEASEVASSLIDFYETLAEGLSSEDLAGVEAK